MLTSQLTNAFGWTEKASFLLPVIEALGAMRRIQQKSLKKADCGVACLAMVTGWSYPKALEKLGFDRNSEECYTTHLDLIKALGRRFISKGRFKSMRVIKGIAIVKVNPSNNGNNWHWVVLNATGPIPYLLDPAPGKRGRIVDFRGMRGAGEYLSIRT